MLAQLIELTNSPEFLTRGGHTQIREVNSLSVEVAGGSQDSIVITLAVEWDAPEADQPIRQLWEIVCQGVVDSGRLQSYVGHYPAITLQTQHPVLFNFEGSETCLHLQGPCTDISALIGALYLAHEQACGHWSDFPNIVFGVPEWLQQQGEAELVVPTPLAEAYMTACEAQGIACTVTDTSASSRSRHKLRALIWQHPEVHPVSYKIRQPYVVAEYFEATRI